MGGRGLSGVLVSEQGLRPGTGTWTDKGAHRGREVKRSTQRRGVEGTETEERVKTGEKIEGASPEGDQGRGDRVKRRPRGKRTVRTREARGVSEGVLEEDVRGGWGGDR